MARGDRSRLLAVRLSVARSGTASARLRGSGTRSWRSACPPARAGGAALGAEARPQAARGPWRRAAAPRLLSEVGAAPMERMATGIGELDRVLGGGLVPGSLVLLGGSPGIGKSTLTNMVLGHLRAGRASTLYVSGEESAEQVQAARRAALRQARLHGAGARRDRSRGGARRRSPEQAPQACVIDSVQTLRRAELSGAPGSVGQVREVAARIMELAKARADRGDPRRPRDQGRRAGRPARARAPGRLRAAVRGRARAPLPRAARAEEPLRLDQRGGAVRDAPGRPGGGARRLRAVRRRGHARARERGAGGDGGLAARCSWRSRRSWRRRSSSSRAGWSRASTATAWRSCSRSSAATAACGTGGADVFVNVVGGVRVDEPGVRPGGRAGGREREPRRADSTAHPPSPRACFGELGLTGELRWVGHPERRLAEAASTASTVIAPPGSGGRACEAAHAARGARGRAAGAGDDVRARAVGVRRALAARRVSRRPDSTGSGVNKG